MKDILVGGKVTSLDLSRDETKLAVCSRDDKIQVRVLITNPFLCLDTNTSCRFLT